MSAEFDVAFLALPHTLSSAVAGTLLARGIPVIDLSADFRFRNIPLYESVYAVATRALPWPRRRSTSARDPQGGDPEDTPCRRPGCFPTS